MNLCWIIPRGQTGHVRDLDSQHRAALLLDGYEEFRLTCTSPGGTRAGSLYVQGARSRKELASHVAKCGLALFGGCTSVEVHRPTSAKSVILPHADLAGMLGRARGA